MSLAQTFAKPQYTASFLLALMNDLEILGAVELDQDWDREETTATFKDGSIIVFSGNDFEYYDSARS